MPMKYEILATLYLRIRARSLSSGNYCFPKHQVNPFCAVENSNSFPGRFPAEKIESCIQSYILANSVLVRFFIEILQKFWSSFGPRLKKSNNSCSQFREGGFCARKDTFSFFPVTVHAE